jgi:prepilin signal peptidase PulO-like enzyme (type II secretory pathway)
MTALNIFVGTLLALACFSDLRTRRIPNVLTLSAAGGALLFHLATGGLVPRHNEVGLIEPDLPQRMRHQESLVRITEQRALTAQPLELAQ